MKRMIASVVTFALLLFPTTAFAEFSDVNSGTDYNASIDWMNENGVIEGYSDGTFGPDKCVNRAEFLKMLFLTLDVEANDSVQLPFSDVSDDDWFAPYVKTAYTRGTVEGYSDGTFRPGDCVNRVEALKMNMLEFDIDRPVGDMGSSYVDVNFNTWYSDYFETAMIRNLLPLEHVTLDYENTIYGEPGKLYVPDEGMSRGEVAELLYRSKAMVDNDAEVYTEDLTPNSL